MRAILVAGIVAVSLGGCFDLDETASGGVDEVALAFLQELSAFPEWHLDTSEGTIRTILYADWLPETTANIIRLTEAGYYDGTLVYRVIDDFVMQGGDENESDAEILLAGEGVPLEFVEGLDFGSGAMGLARLTRDDGTGHYFLTEKPALHLSRPGSVEGFVAEPTPQTAQRAAYGEALGPYALYGQAFDGFDVIRTIAQVETDANDKPVTDIVVNSATVLPPPADADLINLVHDVHAGMQFDGHDGIFEHPRIMIAGHPITLRYTMESGESGTCPDVTITWRTGGDLGGTGPLLRNAIDTCTFESNLQLGAGDHSLELSPGHQVPVTVLPWNPAYSPFVGTPRQ